MEVGAVKQAFNNEVILLKKKLNQAKIQIIHKLTRKAKQLAEKKAPEPLKEKLKRKAESAVNEVLIIKKIKPKDLAQFIVTHKGELKDFLNKPTVDNEKACARLLLHKALQDKYKFLRSRFSNVPIQDLFMSRLERRKMKKEEKEKQKHKKKAKNSKVVTSEGDWNVEDVLIGDKKKLNNVLDKEDDQLSDDGGVHEENDSQSEVEMESQENEVQSELENETDDDEEITEQKASDSEENNAEPEVEKLSKPANITPKSKALLSQKKELLTKGNSDSEEENSEPEVEKPSKQANITPRSKGLTLQKPELLSKDISVQKEIIIKPRETQKKPEKKHKDANKNRNFNEKIQQRKFKKDADAPIEGNKIVDPFFITATGENYLSVVEPRGPDEIKEEHKQGNRKLRRAVMFGHVPKPKPRRENNNYRDDNRFNQQNGFDKGDNFRNKGYNNKQDFGGRKSFNNDFNDRKGFNNGFNDRKRFNDKVDDEKPEKLHPSWEAKKKKSGILPFEGKKIVFD